jgi:hypothetical protein
MYFEEFPNFLYDFDVNGKRKAMLMTDITRNVRFRRDILSNITVFPFVSSSFTYGSKSIVLPPLSSRDMITDFRVLLCKFRAYVDLPDAGNPMMIISLFDIYT